MKEPKLTTYTDALEGLFRAGDANAHEKLQEAANVRLIQNIMLAIGQEDLTTVGDMLAEDARLEIRGADDVPLIRDAQGRAQVLAAVAQNFAAVHEQRPRIEAVIAQGDTVIVMLEEEGEVRATGQRYRLKGMQRFRMREQKVAMVEELLLPM